MSQSEHPERLVRGREPTLEDLRELMAPATPAFALQLRERVRRLIASLASDHPVREEGERMMEELRRLGFESGEPRGPSAPDERA